jgi:hypothetical protein
MAVKYGDGGVVGRGCGGGGSGGGGAAAAIGRDRHQRRRPSCDGSGGGDCNSLVVSWILHKVGNCAFESWR